MKRIAKILVARDYTDDESYEMFEASIQLAKADALGDYIIQVLEDVRNAAKSENPAEELVKLEKSLKADMNAVNKHVKELRPKAEKEMDSIRTTLKQKKEDKAKADQEDQPVAASVRKLIRAAKKLLEDK